MKKLQVFGMIVLPPHLFRQYRSFFVSGGVRECDVADYLKRLRYFLDFCEKYHIVGEPPERIEVFLNKLRQKGQPEGGHREGRISIFYFTDNSTLPFTATNYKEPRNFLQLRGSFRLNVDLIHPD